MKKILLLLFALSVSLNGWSQSVTVRGQVIDSDTKEGIPFANVYFDGTGIGTATDLEGFYELVAVNVHDSLVASAVGFQTLKKSIGQDSIQTINFLLSAAEFTLSEVVVLAGENPADEIVRNIIKNKEHNRLEHLESFQYESYAKIELDLENISPKIQNNKLLKPFRFIFENIDSTSDEKPFLPVYINEIVSDVYYIKDGGKPKNVLRAQRTSGIKNESFIEFIKKIHEDFSIYDNWIKILERPFVSPFANAGLGYYEYYIIDSALVNGKWSYKLKFKPKRKQESTFYGDFWVADTSFAIQRLNMRMSPDAGINLVSRIIIFQEFEPKGENWLPVKQKMVVDFTPTKKSPGLIARRTETFKDFRMNENDIRNYYADRNSEFYQQEELERSTAYWDTARHEPLSKVEKQIYQMVDTLTNMPLYKTYTELFETIFTGYLEIGNYEFGPYFSLYSNNVIEGHRFRFGGRTNSKFDKQVRLGGYLAYGLRDERFKYGADFDWLINKRPRILVGAAFRDDISFNSESSEEFVEGDLFSGSLRRNIVQKLIHVQEGKAYLERFWNGGFSNRFTILHRNLDPYGNLNGEGTGFNYSFLTNANALSDVDTTIATTELIFKTRFAYGEEFVQGRISQISIGTEHPIIELQYTMGIDGFLGGDYTYHKLSLYYRHYFNINPIGWFAYRFKAGKVFGTVPFLLMEVHPGNESYFMTRGIFNTMNRYEFASDTYFSAVFEHHFDGFILNKIPLIRKLGLRSVASLKGVIGSLSEANKAANRLNTFEFIDKDTYSGFRAPTQGPYLEAGIGVENILKVLRFDALWRLSYLDNPEASRFTVVSGLYFFF